MGLRLKKNVMIKRVLIGSLVLGALALQNCGTETPAIPAAITAPTVNLPAVSGVDGVILAMNTRTKESGVEIMTGTGQAIFFKNQSPLTKVDGGTLKLNTKSCIKSDDNTYFYIPTTADPKGIVFGSQIFWQGTGNAANGVPAINDNDGSGFPNIPVLGEFINLKTNQDYALNWISSNGGDSIIVILKGPSASHKKVFANTVSSYAVPKAEIAKLGVGGATVTIINYIKVNKTIGTKTYAFIKQAIAFTAKASVSN